MKSLTSSLAVLAVLCPLLPLSAQEPPSPPPLLQAYTQAVKEADADFAAQREQLMSYYIDHLEELARAAQQQGDLERLIVLKAEQTHIREQGVPPDDEPVPELKEVRAQFQTLLQTLSTEQAAKRKRLDTLFLEAVEPEIQRLTQENQLKEAETLDTLRQELVAKRAPDPTPEPKPAVRLGPNLLPDGSFDEAPERAWWVSAPGGRNKSGLYQEPNSGMNMTLRLEQEERGAPVAIHSVRLEPGKTYRIRWRARMLRPWRAGIEMRGKGYYKMGFQIPHRTWSAWTPLERSKNRHTNNFNRQPPPDREWRWYEANLKCDPWQSEFFISGSQGEGDFLVDDIEIREVLPPEKPKEEALRDAD